MKSTVTASATRLKTIRVCLTGNPNVGKTTIFNALVGSRQRTGNYAGVTVEKKEGAVAHHGYRVVVYDLPGTYSLTAYSPDERIARDFLLNERPDVVVDVLDSANMRRNLFLSLQLVELGIPVVGALNMTDQAGANGIRVDDRLLGDLLGFPFVRTVGTKGKGMHALLDAIVSVFESGQRAADKLVYGDDLERDIGALADTVAGLDAAAVPGGAARWTAIKLLEKDVEVRRRVLAGGGAAAARQADALTAALEVRVGRDAEVVVSERRYAFIGGACAEAVTMAHAKPETATDRVDAVLLHRVWGVPIFLLVMWSMFRLTFALGALPSEWIENGVSLLAAWLSNIVPEGIVRSFLINGIVSGVGGVLSFLPPVVILFFLLALLEDTGYMARAAFVSDRFLHAFGLHGQSFFPLILGFGCSVPAIMAARTLKNPRDRIVTALVTPFMSCGAKLPVYVVIAAACFQDNPQDAVFAIYLIGAVMSLLAAAVLRRTVARGDPSPFVMELPPYRAPSAIGLVRAALDRAVAYLKRAGTVILAASVIVWAAMSFPTLPAGSAGDEADALAYSVAGRLGRLIEPVVQPLGFDWRAGVAVVSGMAAKEVVVSTLGVLYRTGDDGGRLSDALRADPGFSPLVGFVLMLFVALSPPCLSALAALRAELGARWLAFGLAMYLAVAWLAGFAVFRVGSAIGLG